MAHAQSNPSIEKISLFGGYSYLVNDWGNGCAADFGGETTALHGYAGSGVYNINKHIGIEGNFTGHNGTPTIFKENATSTENGFKEFERQDIYLYTVGPKVTQSIGNFQIFA